MKTVRNTASLREQLAAWRAGGETVALVPTMGNLHAGHVSLVRLASEQADRVVASIFVNPTQFGAGEDFAAYPRTLEHDRRRLTRAGADLLFAPAVEDIYPEGPSGATVVSVPGLSTILCGASRPGHFDGVTSVVARLFNLVQPDVSVFGKKDYQQLLILSRMARDLHFPLRIVAGETCRDGDGLALSSRNQYLSPAERRQAPALYAALTRCARELHAGCREFGSLEAAGGESLRSAGLRPDYFVIRRSADLAEPAAGDSGLVVLAAAFLGRARLIDNIVVEVPVA